MPELAALPGALQELTQSTDYDQVFGITGIPRAHVLEVFDLARQWSAMHHAATTWDRYARAQEGMAWIEMRALLEKMKMAFALASVANPVLTTKYMKLRAFLGAAKATAAKGASTRRANGKAVAKGEPATHGVVGKQRQKAAQKAAYDAAQAQSKLGTTSAPAAPSNASTPGGAPSSAANAGAHS